MKKVLVVSLWTLISLAGLANADSIPIGQLSYLGTTPDGSSIFKVSLNPPAGISLTNLVPSIYIGDDKFTFALPTSGDFLFLSRPGTPFANCPCTDAHIDFLASAGTTVTFEGQTFTTLRMEILIITASAGSILDSKATSSPATSIFCKFVTDASTF